MQYYNIYIALMPRPMVYSGNDVDEQFRCSSVRSEMVDFRHRCSVGKFVRPLEL